MFWKARMYCSNYDLVKDRIKEFKQFLQEFKEANAAYHSQFRDKNEIKVAGNSVQYFSRLGV